MTLTDEPDRDEAAAAGGRPRPLVRMLRLVGDVMSWSSVALVLLMALPIAYEAMSRAAGYPSIWVFEITVYTLIAAGFLANSVALRHGAHFRIEMMLHLFPNHVRAFNVLALVATLFVAIAVVWAGWVLVEYSLANAIRSDTLLSVPLYLPQLAIPLGGLALGLEAAAMLIAGDYPLHSGEGE